MFGFKRKQPRPNPLWDRIHDQMKHELHHNDDEESSSYADIKWVISGRERRFQAQISSLG